MPTQTKEQLKTISKDELVRLPLKTLPRSMEEAAGILKRKYTDLKRHYQKIRKEWPSYAGKR